MAWARANVVPVAILERTAYHRDEVGQNARSIIEAMRIEAAKIEAQASVRTSAAIGGEASRHTKRWTATVAGQAQIDLSALLRDDDLVDFLSIRSEQANGLIKSLSADVMQRIERETLGAIFEGRSNAEIAKALQGIDDISRRRATLIARDQASKLNGAMNQFRQEQAGISHYKWRTILDGRERPSHHANNNKIFSWATPPRVTGHPGHDINCRCRALAVITDDPDDLEALPDEPLGDWYDENLPLVRAVAPTPSQPVFGFRPEDIAERLAQTRELQAKVAALTRTFTEADAERLVVELYGFKPSEDDLLGLLTGIQKLTASRRTVLIEAAKARLSTIENLLTQASVTPALPAAAILPAAPVASPRVVTPKPAPRPAGLPKGRYSERLAGDVRTDFEAVQQSRKFVRDQGKRTGHEWAIMHDDEGRDLVRLSTGKKNYVQFDRNIAPELYSARHRLTVHHNHPSSTSFSVADVKAFGGLPGLDILYAHGQNGNIFRLRVLDRVRAGSAAKTAEIRSTRLLTAAARAGEISYADANALHAHVRMLILVKRGVVQYEYTFAADTDAAAQRAADVIARIVADG